MGWQLLFFTFTYNTYVVYTVAIIQPHDKKSLEKTRLGWVIYR